MRKIISGLIAIYRYLISPLLGLNCRYTPSCSEYAQTAVIRFGVLKGGWIAIKRIFSCHPWGNDGYDPVPEKKPAFDKKTQKNNYRYLTDNNKKKF